MTDGRKNPNLNTERSRPYSSDNVVHLAPENVIAQMFALLC